MILDASEVGYGKRALSVGFTTSASPMLRLSGEECLARRDGSGADPKGIRIPNGFAITAEGYWSVVRAGG